MKKNLGKLSELEKRRVKTAPLVQQPLPLHWEKKWVYTSEGPRECEVVHHAEHKQYVVKLSHCMRDCLPEHAVFNTKEEAEQAFKDGKIKLSSGDEG